MLTRCTIVISLLLVTLNFTGCGGKGGDAGSGSKTGTEYDKLVHEACDLSLKILAERESGKNVDEVNQKFAQEVAEIDARIAKLPKLTDDQDIKLLQANASKLREVETKYSALAEKGTLNETGKRLKLPNYAFNTADTDSKK